MQRFWPTALLMVAIASGAGAHEGCQTAAHKTKAQAVPKKGLCAPCVVKQGKRSPEAVKARLKYKGKLYTFCSPNCKAAFINSPVKYAKAVK